MTQSRGILAKRRPWGEVELRMLRESYADSRTDDLAAALGRTLTTVYQKAISMGLRKSAEYLATDNACRIQRGKQNEAMKAAQFKPGLTPWNKGAKGVTGTQEACRATQFKPGAVPHTWKPIGTLRINADGVLERKVTDDGRGPRDWVGVHRLVWIEANGPVPDGHVVVFKPGRKTTELEVIAADFVECVTREELMRRNSYHTNYPPEVAKLIQLRGAINRQINKRAKETA